jgi:3-hydroxybutyryl-CoA dehydratase
VSSGGRQRSMTIDELEVGDAEESTREVSAEDILTFARITGDFNPVHTDATFARDSRFGGVIAHGPMALGLAGEIVGTRLPGLGTIALSSRIRHRRPIFAGDRITTRAEISSVDREARRVTLGLTWVNQDGELVGDGETVVLPPLERLGVPRDDSPAEGTEADIA